MPARPFYNYLGQKAYFGSLTDAGEIRRLFDSLLSEPPSIVALDTETVSLKDTTPLGIGIALPSGDSFYFDFNDPELPWHLIWPSTVRKIWHNSPFDLSREVLGRFSPDIDNIDDTAIITRMLNIETELSVASEELDTQTESSKVLLNRFNAKKMTEVPRIDVATKCCRDAQATMQLFQKYRPVVDNTYYEIERKITSMLLHMSHRGIKVDQLLAKNIYDELDSNSRLYEGLCEAQGFNPHSPQQVAYILSALGVFLPWRRGAKQPTVDQDALENIAIDAPGRPQATLTLLAKRYRRLQGVVANMVGQERVYSHFRLDSRTRRITSSDMQLHNIPKGEKPGDIMPIAGPVRRILDADSGTFTVFDLSQIELRVLAYLSGDVEMQRVLSLPKDAGGDIHADVQRATGIPTRVMTKNFVFGGCLYGGGARTISKFTGIKDLALIEEYQRRFNEKYRRAAAWIQYQRMEGLRKMEVTTLYGQKLRLYSPHSDEPVPEKHIMNCAVNYPIQGSAGEIFKRVLVKLAETVPIEDFILQVHDEQLLDGIYTIPDEIQSIAPFRTPFDIRYPIKWQ